MNQGVKEIQKYLMNHSELETHERYVNLFIIETPVEKVNLQKIEHQFVYVIRIYTVSHAIFENQYLKENQTVLVNHLNHEIQKTVVNHINEETHIEYSEPIKFRKPNKTSEPYES